MTVKIESKIPVPPVREAKNKRYPFGEMKIGDSFSCNGFDRTKVANAAHAWGKVNGKKFTIQQTTDGHRCWRIA